MQLWDLKWPARYRETLPKLEAARLKARDGADPESLKIIGEWYWECGVFDWAADVLQKAKEGGADVSPLLIARAHWAGGNESASAAWAKEAAKDTGGTDPYANLWIKTIESTGITPAADERRLTGRVIGTDGAWSNSGNTKEKAFDGNTETFFDAPDEHRDDAWIGYDLGTARVMTRVRFFPRSEHEPRMVGGKFQGCSSPSFDRDVVDLAAVELNPEHGKWVTLPVKIATAFRYVRYQAPAHSNGAVAEIQFFGKAAATVATMPSTMPSAGSRQEPKR